ncbi:MAG: hypothetical protein AUJ52_13105 [Elusimicrobia bacterium CG1_02_63_36]|nr:MAG: hypothetical protein AUJ52_13105 [Elusimicrobia bacterium CG1_02_63_36]PIP84363.1 MAG: hypothetical protein COR54_04150 [Elusimicrobia bacterium CG22_combo_CG10-13_8_21_14_all_63_91]PJA18616.1 MAG: hypothetical protein COX66_00420 [Elusimicrobia bacterium CG_4_10_14_0_2_um_filter_63_34]PJB23360.1 MAG: hypothetical protein CO113_18135 [Elusimicrobia bacterium CG_4_9_14_3_um_filter_62_55]
MESGEFLGKRPRERIWSDGVGALTDRELLCAALGTGVRGLPVERLADGLLERYPGCALLQASVSDLAALRGLGPARAAGLAASFEFSRRAPERGRASASGEPLSGPLDVWRRLADFRGAARECFAAFYLDAAHRVLEREIVSVGTLTESLVHPREVFAPAVERRAAAVIVAHNHPSGDPRPSEEDRAVTRRLCAAGRLLGIPLLDHVVVSATRWDRVPV